ncbi:MAG: hypothetical protein ACI89F_000429, partial [Porticoccaceae bacterium]
HTLYPVAPWGGHSFAVAYLRTFLTRKQRLKIATIHDY